MRVRWMDEGRGKEGQARVRVRVRVGVRVGVRVRLRVRVRGRVGVRVGVWRHPHVRRTATECVSIRHAAPGSPVAQCSPRFSRIRF